MPASFRPQRHLSGRLPQRYCHQFDAYKKRFAQLALLLPHPTPIPHPIRPPTTATKPKTNRNNSIPSSRSLALMRRLCVQLPLARVRPPQMRAPRAVRGARCLVHHCNKDFSVSALHHDEQALKQAMNPPRLTFMASPSDAVRTSTFPPAHGCHGAINLYQAPLRCLLHFEARSRPLHIIYFRISDRFSLTPPRRRKKHWRSYGPYTRMWVSPTLIPLFAWVRPICTDGQCPEINCETTLQRSPLYIAFPRHLSTIHCMLLVCNYPALLGADTYSKAYPMLLPPHRW